ncbi:MAG: hypothetical protein MZU97_03700 [Bacillus subtilis]|nr:hypothetical protein [Bacillus subtilis]
MTMPMPEFKAYIGTLKKRLVSFADERRKQSSRRIFYMMIGFDADVPPVFVQTNND